MHVWLLLLSSSLLFANALAKPTSTSKNKACKSDKECLAMKKERRTALKARASPTASSPGLGEDANGDPVGGRAIYHVSNGYQYITLDPGLYQIIAQGGSGGTGPGGGIPGGTAAEVGGFFRFTETTEINMIVGGVGSPSAYLKCRLGLGTSSPGGGGGMSLVFFRNNSIAVPLLVAGGGAGANFDSRGEASIILQSATDGVLPQAIPGAGQSNCNDDPRVTDSGLPFCESTAGGGAAWDYQGGDGVGGYTFTGNPGQIQYSLLTGQGGAAFSPVCDPGQAFCLSEFQGGYGYQYTTQGTNSASGDCGADGGFGGGGGSGSNAGGGGGGYSGGSPTGTDGSATVGQSGTSFISPLVDNSPGIQSAANYGDGFISIQLYSGSG